jgi:hypothetical protein
MRIVHHSVLHQQQLAAGKPSREEDSAFYDAQLERSIALALVAVGFDCAAPEALEAFRGEVEQCMHLNTSLIPMSKRI